MTGRLINEYICSTVQKAIDGGYAKLRKSKYLLNADLYKVTVYIGKLRVHIYKKDYILDLGELKREDGPSSYVKIWKNDVGGLLIKDIKKGNTRLYKEITIGTVTKCLVREMTHEEVEASAMEYKPYSIVVFNKDAEPSYYCIIKVIEYKNTYADEGGSWYSEIYNPEDDEELQKKLKKEELTESVEEEVEDEEPQFADLGLTSYNESGDDY